MKDIDNEVALKYRPAIEPLEGLVFCLDALLADSGKSMTDTVACGLSYEELIGVLLVARDSIRDQLDFDGEVE